MGVKLSLLLQYYISLAAAMALGLMSSILFIIIQVILLVDLVHFIAKFLYIILLLLYTHSCPYNYYCDRYFLQPRQKGRV